MKKLFALALFMLASIAGGTDYYASTNGSGSACTQAAPCLLRTAIGGMAHGGDTIYVRGGTYSGMHSVYGAGSSDTNRLVIVNYVGEKVTIDGINGGDSNPAVIVQGSTGYIDFKSNRAGGFGLEVISSDPARVSSGSFSSPPDIYRPDAFKCWQHNGERRPGIRLMGVILHDDRQGFSWSEECPNAVFNNVISYYHGWDGSDRGHGHGVYIHSTAPDWKHITNSIFGPNFGLGFQGYGSSDISMDNIEVDHSIVFNGGALSRIGGSHNISMGTYGGPPGKGWNLHDNVSYRTGQRGNGDLMMPYNTNSIPVSPKLVDNYLAGEIFFRSTGTATVTGNVFAGLPIDGITPAQYPNNTFLNGVRPTVNVIKVFPVDYEPGCNVAVLNWQNLSSVSVNLSTCGFANGAGYLVRSAMNYFGPNVATGTYSAASPIVSLSTSPSVVTFATPVNWPAPPNACPEFCVYVIVPTLGGAPSPTPTQPPAPSATATKSPIPTTTSTTPMASPTPSQTPTPGPSGQSIYLEAESGNRLAPMLTASDPLASGGVYLTSATRDAGSVSFSITAIASGATHYVWHRTICLNDTGNSDSLFVSLDGESDAPHIDDMCEGSPRGTAWLWTKMTDRALGQGTRWSRSFSSGSHTLTLRAREINTKLDRIAVTTDPNWIPSDIAPQPTPTQTATPVPPSPTTTPSPTVTPSNTPPLICNTATATPTP